MSLPRRSAISRQRSFSIKPCGPIVPVSCPPCPASITIRLIFNPKARVSERFPSRVGFDSVGVINSADFVDSLPESLPAGFEFAAEVFAGALADSLLAFAPIAAVFAFAAELTDEASVTAANFASVSGLLAADSLAAGAGVGGATLLAVCAVFDFTSITNR